MEVNKPTVYLSGGMEKSGEAGVHWREEITPLLEQRGYTVFNPYRQPWNREITPEEMRHLRDHDFSLFMDSMRKKIDLDLSKLVGCAAAVVKIDDSVLGGSGTFGELTLCYYYKIPVYAWVDLPGGIEDVPLWALGCLTSITCSRDYFYSSIPRASSLTQVSWEKHLEEYVKEWEEEGFSDR